MKIGILTLRLYDNYGGILQNYALCRVLNLMGHEVETFKLGKPFTWKSKIKNYIKKLFVDRKKENTRISNCIIQEFINNKIPQTDYILNSASQFMHDTRVQKYDAYIVGSDQVWRRPYMEFGLKVMFLNFVKGNRKKISYAASFGIEDLSEYSTKEILLVKKYLSTFNGISVREDDGVRICNSIGINAINVLDPVFLLSRNDYVNLAMQKTLPSEGNLFVYILDNLDKNNSQICEVAKKHNFSPFFITLNLKKKKSVEQWLRSFYDADFIITDSFHACAFSIIFNKDFYIIGNKGRGLSRIKSLLKQFYLENRLIHNMDDLYKLSFDKIDWSVTNKQYENLKEISIKFLQKKIN